MKNHVKVNVVQRLTLGANINNCMRQSAITVWSKRC